MPLSSQDVPPPTSLSLLSRPLSSFPSRRSGCPSFGCPSSDFTIISPAYPSSPDHTPGAPSAHPSQMFPWLNHRPLLRLRALPWPGLPDCSADAGDPSLDVALPTRRITNAGTIQPMDTLIPPRRPASAIHLRIRQPLMSDEKWLKKMVQP
ncbi:hypothetical protein I350_01863 [Cryptococcus amylolentus CBS 6273]|uniref:Uncharacterized protein n=1 Tax=Cryptococcus amylolentus CBS 6273 TaxID=1296118 RepID=A0A1E3K936_9TREE|nr:hypothetical protein I350_01863 [Cryptococcus amylolentus CBS 6273]